MLSTVGRNMDKFEVVLERIKVLGVKDEPLIILGDFSLDFERIISETIEKYRGLDVLIHNVLIITNAFGVTELRSKIRINFASVFVKK